MKQDRQNSDICATAGNIVHTCIISEDGYKIYMYMYVHVHTCMYMYMYYDMHTKVMCKSVCKYTCIHVLYTVYMYNVIQPKATHSTCTCICRMFILAYI